MSEPKLNIKEESSAKKTRSPPKKTKVEQSVPKKKKLKTDAEKTAEKAQHLRFGKAELTPDELSRLSKAQKREMYAAHAARSAVHHEVDQYEDENVGVQALSEGEKAAGNVRDISKSRYARKLKKKAKMQGKKGTKTAKSSASEPTAAQDAGASGTGEGGSNWLSRWRQKQDIRQSYYAAARSGTAAQTAGGKAASNGASAARSGVEQAVEKGKTAVSTAVKGLMNAAKGNAHVLVIVGVFLLLILMVMSGFSSCGILFSGGTQVSGQTMYSAEDRDIRGAEQDYKKLEKELDKKIKRTPADHPGYNEYQFSLFNNRFFTGINAPFNNVGENCHYDGNVHWSCRLVHGDVFRDEYSRKANQFSISDRGSYHRVNLLINRCAKLHGGFLLQIKSKTIVFDIKNTKISKI